MDLHLAAAKDTITANMLLSLGKVAEECRTFCLQQW
jgi:hypothetical protein